MYLEHYSLREFPFALTCDEKFFYESSVHAETLANMMYTIQSRKGMVLITGDVGTGKTFLVNMLQHRMEQTCVTVNLQNPPQSGKQLLRGLATQLGLRVDNSSDKMHLLENVERHLVRASQRGRIVSLVMDEAQDLPDDTLNEIRLLANWEHAGQRLIQIILVGQPEIKSRLMEEKWESFRQRIVLTFNLAHLTLQDVAGYIDHRVAVAGGEGCTVTFDAAAKEDVYYASQGVPRLINVICDNALLQGYLRKTQVIDHGIMAGVLKETTLWDFGHNPDAAATSQPSAAKDQPAPPEVSPVEPVSEISLSPEEIHAEHIEQSLFEKEDGTISLSSIEAQIGEVEHEADDVDKFPQPDKYKTQEQAPEVSSEKPQSTAKKNGNGNGNGKRASLFTPTRHEPKEPVTTEGMSAPKPIDKPDRTPIYQLSGSRIAPADFLSSAQPGRHHPHKQSIDEIDNKLRMSDMLVSHSDRGGAITEEFRALRTTLLAANPDEQFCYLITSPESADGKTLTCLNLALVMIERMDYKTVVVDCDLRKGMISKYLKGRRSPGVADLLRGTASMREITQPTAYPNMFFIPAGHAHKNEVGELVGGPELTEFITDLRRTYDYVIIDTPPINTFSDVGMLGLATGEALLVVRMNKTKRDSIEKAIRLLGAANVKLTGMVLTDRRHFMPKVTYS